MTTEQPNVGNYTVTGAVRRKLLPGEQFILLSEGSDKGTPMLLGDAIEQIGLGEIYE